MKRVTSLTHYSRNAALGGVLLSIISPANITFAADQKGFVLEEIVVTARKREESLQSTPISVAAFTANDLKRRQINSSDQLTQVTPNLQFSSQAPSSGSNASSQIFIRGIGQTEFLPTTDPGVGLYVDGVYMARSVGGTLDFMDVQRIEVLRGPQGTLFGRNTIGGAISIHTKKPAETFGGSASVKVGSYNRRDFLLSMDIPLSETLLTRFSIGKRNRDGYVIRTVDGKDLGNDNTFGANAAVLWTPTENFELLLRFDYNKENENGAPQVFNSIATTGLFARVASAKAGCPAPGTELADSRCANNQQNVGPYKTNGTFPVISTLEGWGTSMTATWDLGAVTLKSITAYRDMKWLASRDADNTPETVLHTRNDDTQNQFSQEFQVSGTAIDDRLNWLTGAYYFKEQATDDYYVEIPFGNFNTGGLVDNDTKALFAQATYDFTDKLSLTAGLRYTSENKAFTPIQSALTTYFFPIAASEKNSDGLYVHPVTGETFPTVAGGNVAMVPGGTIFFAQEEVKNNISEVTPMVNLAYQWSDDIMTYFNYAEGFKSGGYNARNVKPGATPRLFAPEFSKTFEIGFKGTFFDNTLRLNGSVFRTNYTDLQFVIREDFAPIVFNAGKAVIKGFELEWTYVPVPNLQIVGGVGYTSSEYKELSPELVANGGVALSNQLPHAPDWSTNLGVAYEIFLGENGSVTPRIDWSYQSKKYFDANNTEAIAQDGYNLLNAAIYWTSPDEAWTVTAAVTNLGDKLYRLAGNSSLHASASYAESTYARPREWSLSVDYNF